MAVTTVNDTDTGLEVIDVQNGRAFAKHHGKPRDFELQIQTMERLARAFVEAPEGILQELVNAAVSLCGADSAGISVEKEDATEAEFYHWVATAGRYSPFLDAVLPKYPSACGVCLERGAPQRFRVGQRFFDLMGIQAPLVTDGILLPWQVDETRGTVFIMAHGRDDAFDEEDTRIMQLLADFAAMGVRQKRQQNVLLGQEKIAAAGRMANMLAHRINNPLQSLANLVYLASEGRGGEDAKALADELSPQLARLSALIQQLLSLPGL